MKKSALLVILFCTCSVFAQDLSKAYRITRTDLGQLYDGSLISAKTYSFNFPVYDKQIDTTAHMIYFTVREKDGSGKFYKNNGNQFALDYKRDTIVWINDVRKFEITDAHDYLMMSSDVNTSRINKSTGLEQVQHPGKLVFVDEKNKVGLTYSVTPKGIEKKTINGVGIEDASVKFTTSIPSEYDWDEAIKINDSVVLISASGLYGVNLKSGATWSVTDITGERNKQKLIQSIINPNAFRVKQNSFLESESEDVITQMCSNILVDGSVVYFAGKNNLYSINTVDGKVNWKLDVSKYATSKSALFLQGGKLYMLNLGVANFKDRQIVYGSPYLLQADVATGQLNFNNPLPMFAYPVDFQIGSDLVMAGKNNLYFISLNDGKFFNEIDVNELRYGNFQEFVSGDDYYVEKEGYFVPLNFINDNVIYFHSTHGKIYGVEGGRIQYEYHESELYRFDKTFGSHKLIKQKFKTYIVSGNFELVGVIDVEDPATVVGNSLYYFAGRKLHVLKSENFKK